jgi:hypothetical protein
MSPKTKNATAMQHQDNTNTYQTPPLQPQPLMPYPVHANLYSHHQRPPTPRCQNERKKPEKNSIGL